MSTLLDYLGVSRPQKKISWSLSSICHHFLLYNFIFLFPAVRLEVKIEGCYWIFGMRGQFDHGEINFLVQRMVLSWWYGGIYADSPRLSRNLLDTEPIPCSPVEVTKKLPDKRKLTLVAHKKLRLKLHMFKNIQNHQASCACITVSGFIFLCDAHCLLQTERKKFLLCYSYISESLIG